MDRDNYIKFKEQLKLYTYYILIAIISALSVIVFPLLNSSGDIVDTLPKTAIEIVWYIVIRVLIVVMNLLIFSNFLAQAKINVKDDENYKTANKILGRCKPGDYRPLSPAQYLAKTYLIKGTTIVITTVASLFTIANAILRYDYMILIATVFTVLLAIVLGIMTMKKAEIYWTTMYLDYANMVESNMNKLNKKEINKCLQSMISNIEILKNKS